MADHYRGDMAPPYDRAYTPNLDRIAASGTTFSRVYCTAPHCCPARASFFTGLFPSRHGVWNNVGVANALSHGLNDGVRMWSDDLLEAGYRLIYSGKWHVSMEESPEDRGWEMTSKNPAPSRKPFHVPFTEDWKVYSRDPGTLDTEEPAVLRRPGQILRPGYPKYTLYGTLDHTGKGCLESTSRHAMIVRHDEQVIAQALSAIRSRGEDSRPWCHFVGTLGPHDPYWVPSEFLDLYDPKKIKLPDSFSDTMADKPNLYRRTRSRFDQLRPEEHREALQHYLAFCSYEDHLFGKILDALKEQGELDDTLVIFTSDHGDYAGDHGLWAKGLPCFQGAYHIPLVMRWPEGIPAAGKIVDRMVSQVDFAPTLLDLLGLPGRTEYTGRSLLPWMKSASAAGATVDTAWDAPEEIYTQTNGNELYGIQRSVMTREWKYVYNGFDFDELYDLRKDPGERVNLAGDPKYGETVKDLMSRIWRFAYENGDTCVNHYVMVSLAPYGPGIIFQDGERNGT